jgi:hypothetical protein
LELFKAAQQRSGKPSFFQDYANKAQRNLSEAKKDNDFIYHERIPDVKSLPSVGKALLAKTLPVPERLSQNFKGKKVCNTLKIIIIVFMKLGEMGLGYYHVCVSGVLLISFK